MAMRVPREMPVWKKRAWVPLLRAKMGIRVRRPIAMWLRVTYGGLTGPACDDGMPAPTQTRVCPVPAAEPPSIATTISLPTTPAMRKPVV